MRSSSTVASGSLAIHEVSPPEQNAEPSPVTTTTRTERSTARAATAAVQASVIASDIALRWSGLSRTSRATPSAGSLDPEVVGSHARRLLMTTPRAVSGFTPEIAIGDAPVRLFHAQTSVP